MKYIIILINLLGLLSVPILAAEVDFSKAYVIEPKISPTVTGEMIEEVEILSSPPLRIGGIRTTDTRNNEVTVFNWALSLGFNANDVTFYLQDAQLQNHFDVELVQQHLRGTTWKGDYKTANNLYLTELQFKSIQNGFVGCEIIHTTEGESEPSSFLHVKVAGDITPQYLIDEKGDGELIWVAIEKYEKIVAKINEDNEDKGEQNNEDQDITPIPEILKTRQLIRLKRTRRIGNSKHANSQWGSNNEYRFILEDGKLTGTVGTPADRYNTNDGLTGIGHIELTILDSIEISSGLE